MARLFFVLFAVIGTTMAGIGVVIVLSLGWVAVLPIVAAAASGAVLALPATWVVARQLREL
jgi:hypothetical protein